MRVEQVEPSSQNPTRKTDALPATKTRGATLNDDEFAREIEPLKRLQANIKRARTATVDAMLKFACEYAARYKPVKGDRKQVDRLDKALGLNYDASTRWRCVAAVAKRLEPIQKFLPAALEPLYVVTLALKADEGAVQKAIEEGRLTPDSTLREVRAVGEPVNVIGTVLRGREVRGGPYDSAVPPQALKTLVVHLTVPQDRVLRVEEVRAFQQKVEAVLREAFAVRCVEVGVVDDEGDWKGPSDLSRYLGTYWKLMDEVDALKRKVEALAEAAVNTRKHVTPVERELALREARQEAWKPFQERKRQIDEQFKAVFATASNTQARRNAVGGE